MLAGGLPVDFPTISLHESFAQPTSMYLRNLMSIDTEEMIRAQPMDAVVLIGGCDKTVPAQLMGAASAGIPAIQLVTGSMLTGSHRSRAGRRVHRLPALLGALSRRANRRGRDRRRQQPVGRERRHVFGDGHREHDGVHREALGMTVPGGASPPAVTADRIRIAEPSGAQAVQIARDRLTIDKVLTAGRLRQRDARAARDRRIDQRDRAPDGDRGPRRFRSGPEALDRMGRETPVLLDLKPTGQHYMEDFHAAGGMATLLRELKPLLRLDALTVTGRTLGEEIERAGPGFAQDVVRPL